MDLVFEFEQRLRDSIVETRALGYDPTQFTCRFDRVGGVAACKQLVVSGDIQYGFDRLVKMGRPDLTIEAIMLEPRFAPLFSASELAAAQWRLDQVV